LGERSWRKGVACPRGQSKIIKKKKKKKTWGMGKAAVGGRQKLRGVEEGG